MKPLQFPSDISLRLDRLNDEDVDWFLGLAKNRMLHPNLAQFHTRSPVNEKFVTLVQAMMEKGYVPCFKTVYRLSKTHAGLEFLNNMDQSVLGFCISELLISHDKDFRMAGIDLLQHQYHGDSYPDALIPGLVKTLADFTLVERSLISQKRRFDFVILTLTGYGDKTISAVQELSRSKYEILQTKRMEFEDLSLIVNVLHLFQHMGVVPEEAFYLAFFAYAHRSVNGGDLVREFEERIHSLLYIVGSSSLQELTDLLRKVQARLEADSPSHRNKVNLPAFYERCSRRVGKTERQMEENMPAIRRFHVPTSDSRGRLHQQLEPPKLRLARACS